MPDQKYVLQENEALSEDRRIELRNIIATVGPVAHHRCLTVEIDTSSKLDTPLSWMTFSI